MTPIGKVWTAGIAYVALAVGAGLSIMYNILDTMQVRGAAFDWADLVTAVAAPAIVLLMVEMFVSRIWVGQSWHIQIIRWLATLAIGGVAMRTSWTHGHDFMASRGQSADVATLWPLAIDLLAIMATALILAGRTRGHTATPMATAMVKLGDVVDTMATGRTYGHGQDMATDGHVMIGRMATPDEVAMASMAKAEQDDDVAMATQPLSEAYAATLAAELDAWEAGADLAIERAGQELAAEAEATLRTPRVPVATGVPEEAVAMIQAWDGQDGAMLDARISERFGKSARTARRWRSLVTGRPTSGA